MRFEKWQALGNDYLIVEADELPWELNAARVRLICDPHFGLGSDGVLLLSRSDDPEFVAELRIFNPDGSEAELSGNGAREAILYLRRHGWTDADTFSILTVAGPVDADDHLERTCTVDDGAGRDDLQGLPLRGRGRPGTLSAAGREWAFQHVSIGNPQCAIDVGDGAGGARPGRDRARRSKATSSSPTAPTSPSCAIDGSRVRARIFERGVGETLSSGTGASGAAVTAFLRGAPSPITVELDGGELEVEVSPDLDVTLSGWAEPICAGELSPELLAALADAGRLDFRADGESRTRPSGWRRCLPTCSRSWSGASPTSAPPAST